MKRALSIIVIIFICSCNQNTSKEVNIHNKTKIYTEIQNNTVISLYDAFGENKKGMEKDFGFSCILKYNGKTILFDSGTNADIFKKNIEALNIDLSQIDFAVASHAHFDHINGFDYLLKVNPNVKIYFHLICFGDRMSTSILRVGNQLLFILSKRKCNILTEILNHTNLTKQEDFGVLTLNSLNIILK